MARRLLAAGAHQVWLDDPCLDLWQENPPQLGSAFPGLWLRHPAAAPVSPHLKAVGLPVVAGHLGVLRAALDADLEVVADVGLNVANHVTADALAELGARAAVVSLEVKSEHIADLATRSELPLLAIAAGRRLLMASRQDHGLPEGARCRLTAVQSRIPYSIERHIAGVTLIRETEDLDLLRSLAGALSNLAGVVLETGALPVEDAVALVGRTVDAISTPAPSPSIRRFHRDDSDPATGSESKR